VSRGRGRPTGGSSPLSEARLLDGALDLFAEAGYDGTSVRELCRRLGVSHGLVHQRYGSKDRLWFAAVDHGFEDLAGEFVEAADRADDDADEIRQVMVRFLEVTARRPALMQVINQEATSPGPRLDHIVDNYLAPAIEVMEDALARLRADGRAREIDAPVLYILITHGVGGVLSLTALSDRLGLKDTRRDPTAFAEQIVDVVLDGLLVR